MPGEAFPGAAGAIEGLFFTVASHPIADSGQRPAAAREPAGLPSPDSSGLSSQAKLV